MISNQNFVGKFFKYASIEPARNDIIRAVHKAIKFEEVKPCNAYKRVLAEDVIAPFDIPEGDTSHLDGYAVRASDTVNASVAKPVVLKIVKAREIRRGEAAYVLTGSKIPKGADAVIGIERVKVVKDNVLIFHGLKPGESVTSSGADVKRGEILLRKGHMLRAQDIKLLLDLKVSRIKVFKRPRVFIVPVGDEFMNNASEKVESHSVLLAKLISEAGGEAVRLNPLPDNSEVIRKALQDYLEEAEVIITIGGASLGLKDYVWTAVKAIEEASLFIRGIKVVPGRVTSCAIINDKPIIMLPGHVQSMVVGAMLLALPVISSLRGSELVPRRLGTAKLVKKISFKSFIPFKKVVFTKYAPDGATIEPILGDSSMISVLLWSNSFIMVDEYVKEVKEGSRVDVYTLPGLFSI